MRAHPGILLTFLGESLTVYGNAAWIQLSEGKAAVTAVFKTSTGFEQAAGSIVAESKCWSMLKGGLTVNESVSGPSEFYFEVLLQLI